VGWLALGVAIGAEIIGTSALKESDGFSRVLPALVVVVAYGVSFYALSVALRHLPRSPPSGSPITARAQVRCAWPAWSASAWVA
jgi:hypothetical protein